MIDLQLLRNPDFVEQLQNAAKSKRMDFDAYMLAATFDERRRVTGQLDSMRARQKALSARFRDADADTRAALGEEMNACASEVKALRARLQDVDVRLTNLALRAPCSRRSCRSGTRGSPRASVVRPVRTGVIPMACTACTNLTRWNKFPSSRPTTRCRRGSSCASWLIPRLF